MVSTICRTCKQEFAQNERRQGKPLVYCSAQCRQIGKRESSARSYAKRRAMTTQEVESYMRRWHQRKSVKVEYGFDAGHRRADQPARRCGWSVDNVSCITILCRYNPGPYCFHHAEVIESGALADQHRRERRRLEQQLDAELERAFA